MMTPFTVAVSRPFCWELKPLSYMLFLKLCTAKAGTYTGTVLITNPLRQNRVRMMQFFPAQV